MEPEKDFQTQANEAGERFVESARVLLETLKAAEQNRSAEQCYRGKAIKKMYLHAASELQSVADDLRFLEIR